MRRRRRRTAFLGQRGALHYAEAVLFVGYDKPEPMKNNILG